MLDIGTFWVGDGECLFFLVVVVAVISGMCLCLMPTWLIVLVAVGTCSAGVDRGMTGERMSE